MTESLSKCRPDISRGDEIRARGWGFILAEGPCRPFLSRTSRRLEQERMPLEQVRVREPVDKILISYMQV